MEKIKDTFDWFHNEKGDITLTHNEEPFAFVNTEKVAKAVIGKFLEFLTPSQPPPLATDKTLPPEQDLSLEMMAVRWVNEGTSGYPDPDDKSGVWMFNQLKEAFIAGATYAQQSREQERQKAEARIKELQQMLKNGLITGIKEARNKAIDDCKAHLFKKYNTPLVRLDDVLNDLAWLKK